MTEDALGREVTVGDKVRIGQVDALVHAVLGDAEMLARWSHYVHQVRDTGETPVVVLS